MATDAVTMDNAGRYVEAKNSYMLAAEELIRVFRLQTDVGRKLAYRKRAITYLQRAEAIDKMLRRQVAQKRRTKAAIQRAHWFAKAVGRELVLAGEAGEKQSTAQTLHGKKIVCVFVGANWNAECKVFLPELQKFHTLVEAEHPGELQIIFVSQDRTKTDFEALYKAQAW